MRIISQNGSCDLPCEKCFVWINKNNVMASLIGDPDLDYIMAIYSTQGKAEYAMHLLHKACVKHKKLFQFPKEEYL